ncbi:neuronal acetylcholine receptor subunit non-alpha-3-like [Amphiura filiformis]|uniref:neuronal acetylcholine receptor subunit non-alpha-3-like n=1 Tax=Amphiura filiformis TaxID=82378 RepID=UPI003B227A2E
MDIYTICRVACYICLILAQQNIIGVYSANYYRELLDTLFDHTNDYYKVIRPINDSSVPVNVSMQLVLTDITAVEEINHQIELNVWVRQVWKDAFLTWNETEFGGKKTTGDSREFIWIPDITLYNGVGDSNDIKAEGAKLTVSSDGSVRWTVKVTLRSACQMRLISFPFDRQECILRFGSWSYDGTLVNLDILSGVAGFDVQSEYHANSEWDLLSAIAYRKEISYLIPSKASAPPVVLTWPEAFFAIKLKRKFTFYLFTLLVPYFIISSLSGLVFYLQPESGEKMSLAVTTLLSLVVFNEYVMSIVPPSADFFPLLTEYFTIMICWVGMCVLISTWILHIHHQDPKDCSRMGPRLRVFIFVYMARVVGGCGQTKKNDSTTTVIAEEQSSSSPENEIDSSKVTTTDIAGERSSSSPDNEIDSSEATTTDIVGKQSSSSPAYVMGSSKITSVDIAGEPNPSSPDNEMDSSKVTDGRGMLESDVNKIRQFLLTKEEEEKKQEEEEAPLQEWREAAKIVDQFFFGLYNGVNIFLVLVFTLKSVTASYTIEHDF